MNYEYQKGEYLVSTDKAKLDIGFVHHFLSKESYWAQNMPLETLEKCIKNSLTYGVYHAGKQVGFGRIITDYSTIAYLSDIFVISEYRGKGLSKMIVGFMREHPELQNLRRWLLFTSDAHGLYAQFEFQLTAHPEWCMEIVNTDVYKK
jgi:GNAT superfamily N-acetyltransferase